MKKLLVGAALGVFLLGMLLVAGSPQDACAKMEYMFFETTECASGLGIVYYTDNGSSVTYHYWTCVNLPG